MLFEQLGISRGMTAVIGSGGKTTLLRSLSEELAGSVVLCTSTHIFPFAGMTLYTGDDAGELSALLEAHRVVCAGVPLQAGQAEDASRLCAPVISFASLKALADYVIVEADGSKCLPLKAHASYEPVIPQEADRTILVAGASGFGGKIKDVVHRPEIFCSLSGLNPSDPATPEAVARVVMLENLADTVFVNQADTPARIKAAGQFAKQLGNNRYSVVTGALRIRSV